MGLLDAVKAADQRQVAVCGVTKLLARLSKKDGADLQALLALSPTDMPAAQITRGLATIGEVLSKDTISNHRRGACPCGPC